MSPARGHGPARVILVGFMGSGKSTVGRLLASRLGWEFVDTDALVEAHAGETVPAIFRTRGEAAFRDLEAQVLEGLRDRSHAVIATGGGAPFQERNTAFFSQGRAVVFYLRVSLAAAIQRAGTGRDRPLLSRGEPAVRALYESRLEGYESLGTAVDTDGRDPGAVAEEILASLEKGTS